jgi:hypothetical protein
MISDVVNSYMALLGRELQGIYAETFGRLDLMERSIMRHI